jgi:hypothetical protein
MNCLWYPGLYLAGLPSLHNARSGLLFGLEEESAYIAAQIAGRDRWALPVPEAASGWEVSYEI